MQVAPPDDKTTQHAECKSGVLLDCGSGHTSVLWYSQTEGNSQIRQLRRSKLKLPRGGNLKITDYFAPASADDKPEDPDALLARNAKSLAAAICSEIDEATQQHGIPNPTLVFVGATGGLRGALDSGEVTAKQFALFQENLLAGLPSSSHNTFSVISGEDEATWELGAASVIFGPLVRTMFPSTQQEAPVQFGLFSGGGSSVQVQAPGGAPHSFPCPTWWKELDEELGAPPNLWKEDADAWGKWEKSLLGRIQAAAQTQARHSGCFVLTAMCHVAATASGFAETPITAAEAIERLRTSVAQYKVGNQEQEPYGSFVTGKHSVHPTVAAWYTTQPPNHLARVGAMHMCRLAHILELMFDPDARLYAPPGLNSSGERLDCEWTVEAFRRGLE